LFAEAGEVGEVQLLGQILELATLLLFNSVMSTDAP
jgi:hypothetical protein